MIGNVEQWVADCYRESYDATPVDGSAVDDQPCAQRVRRGGSWGLAPWFLRVDYRNSAPPTLQSDAIGFRLARDD
jgi:formylglycine-generating enzyme required for sulfatase activity